MELWLIVFLAFIICSFVSLMIASVAKNINKRRKSQTTNDDDSQLPTYPEVISQTQFPYPASLHTNQQAPISMISSESSHPQNFASQHASAPFDTITSNPYNPQIYFNQNERHAPSFNTDNQYATAPFPSTSSDPHNPQVFFNHHELHAALNSTDNQQPPPYNFLADINQSHESRMNS